MQHDSKSMEDISSNPKVLTFVIKLHPDLPQASPAWVKRNLKSGSLAAWMLKAMHPGRDGAGDVVALVNTTWSAMNGDNVQALWALWASSTLSVRLSVKQEHHLGNLEQAPSQQPPLFLGKPLSKAHLL